MTVPSFPMRINVGVLLISKSWASPTFIVKGADTVLSSLLSLTCVCHSCNFVSPPSLASVETNSKYDAEALELSLSGLMEVVTEELVIPFLLIPIYFYVFFSRRQRFEALREEILEAKSDEALFELEVRVNELIKDRKIKTLHGLILRNTIEEQENKIRSMPTREEE